MNKNIINSEIVVFLGAGASDFLEKPMMEAFIDKFLQETTLTTEEQEILKTFIVVNKKKDLEFILSEIDEICKRKYFRGKNCNYLKDFLDTAILTTGESELSKLLGLSTFKQDTIKTSVSNFGSKYETLCGYCNTLKWKIYRKLFEVYYSVDDIKTKNLFNPFFNLLKINLKNKKITIPVFTTNYDKAIEKFSELNDTVELTDGFDFVKKKKIERWSNETFEKFKPVSKKLNICLFKLHGSIFWYKMDNHIIYSNVVTNFPTDHHIEPVILYPNNTKNILSDPFIAGYSYLQKCLDKTKFIVFVGYSFRDYITITMLKSALRFNKGLKVLIIDPQAKTIYKNFLEWYNKQITCVDMKFDGKGDYLKPLKDFLNVG